MSRRKDTGGLKLPLILITHIHKTYTFDKKTKNTFDKKNFQQKKNFRQKKTFDKKKLSTKKNTFDKKKLSTKKLSTKPTLSTLTLINPPRNFDPELKDLQK